MNHDLLLGAYSMGVLDGDEAAAVEEHVATCAACREELAELTETRDRLAEVPLEAFLDDVPGEAPPDLVLRRTLRSVRRGERRSRRSLLVAVAAAVVVAAAGVGGGVLIGRHDGASRPVAVSALPAGARTATGVNKDIGATMTASLIPADGWVRVKVQMNGAPAGVDCRITVVGKDGSVRQAGSWRTSTSGKTPVVDGAAAVAPADVAAVTVETLRGDPLVTARF
jgi:predicted anti-sigma-YlaC factor YlaD